VQNFSGCVLYPKLSNLLQSFSLSQVVQDVTRYGRNKTATLIDLCLVSSTDHVTECSVIPPLLNSDHNGILMNLRWRLSGQQPLSQARKVWRYANADFPKACELFEHTDWDSVITGDINEALSNWERKFLQVIWKNASPWELFRVNPTYHGLLGMYSESLEKVTYCTEEQRGQESPGTLNNTNWPGTCLLKCYAMLNDPSLPDLITQVKSNFGKQ